MHRLLKILTSRLPLIGILVLVQFCLIVAYIYNFAFLHSLTPILDAIGIFIVLLVINSRSDPAFKIAWIVILLVSPAIGVVAYVLFGNRKLPKKLANGTLNSSRNLKESLENDPNSTKAYKEDVHAGIMYYGDNQCGFPVYSNTETVFYKSGEEWLPVYEEALRSARHFIFIEMFILAEGSLWDEVHAILKEKAAAGVDVKLIYDDFGSVTMHKNLFKELREEGIEAYAFNRLRPALIVSMNNRDHRKITVIDNQIAFTGGVNLADEYANRIRRFGYWRDSAIMVKGPAVWSMTSQFLGIYHYIARGEEKDAQYTRYNLPSGSYDVKGYVQPFADTPTDGEQMGLTEHLSMISEAKRYIYINTPYLILTDSMMQALENAAVRGVDVRILTPHIPDKMIVFQYTQSSYAQLIEAGIRIYEFTPGFNHAKAIVADDEIALVGTINTDYRSYFLHFENGVLLCGTDSVKDIRRDFEEALHISHEVTMEEVKHTNILLVLIRAVLHVFMPLV